MNKGRVVDLATNDIGRDAWGRPKVVTDHSLFSALWTFNVPNRQWLYFLAPKTPGYPYLEQPNGIPKDNSNKYISSEHGHLHIVSDGTNDTHLQSRRHVRYQPNRGYLYSTAVVLPSPTQIGNREFGLNNGQSGVYFRLEGDGTNWKMYASKVTTINGTKDRQYVDITAELLIAHPGFDPSKGHVYDIQMQWRGVGDFFFYIDLKKIYINKMLGTLTEMSVNNPALNVAYSSYGASADLTMQIGCVDVTSEGGHSSNRLPISVGTGTTLFSTTNAGKAVLAVKIPMSVTYNGNIVNYTRDMILNTLTTFCKDESFRSIYFARSLNTPNLEALTWTVVDDSFFEFLDNTGDLLDVAFQLDKANMSNIYTSRNEKDFSGTKENTDKENSPIYISAGDILVLEFLSDGNSTAGATLGFSEEV